MTSTEPGRTFAPEDLGMLDFECRSQEDIKAGTYRYMDSADAIICTFALAGGPVQHVAVGDFVVPLRWDDMPGDFRIFHARVQAGTAKWCAWNAGFDRAAWNYGTVDFPFMTADQIIDAMTQATVSGLPPALKMAARSVKATAKLDEGRALIKLFCLPDSTALPQTHPEEWLKFIAYARGDIATMEEIFWSTRQLPLNEWKEHWAMEKINERGIRIDLKLVQHATWLANEDKRRMTAELPRLTGGAVGTIDEVGKLTKWLLTFLPPEGREILLKREEEIEEDGTVTRPAKYSITRRQVERLIAYVQTRIDHPDTQASYAATLRDIVMRVLQLRLYGGSKSPAKFQKMWAQQINGVLYQQYVPSGAPQTGRASSKGVQIHNLTRLALPYEYDAINAIARKMQYDEFARLGDDSPVARKLALLIRPAFVPADGNYFVWSDWSQIEARVLPWLCDYIPDAAKRLDIFREIDRDPSVPDLYTRTASELLGIRTSSVTKPKRQIGKVAELALGYLGGVGSLHNMAAANKIHFGDDEAAEIVARWRAANPWAMRFGEELWNAAMTALDSPQMPIPCGRLHFIWCPNDLGGSLLMMLPSGRVLTYRKMFWELVPQYNDDDEITGYKDELTYARGHGRAKAWKGTFVENATQAVAADILRGTLVRLSDFDYFDIRGHTHDEVLVECPEDEARTTALSLRSIMRSGFEWSDGLPLMSEETISPYYTKSDIEKVPEYETDTGRDSRTAR